MNLELLCNRSLERSILQIVSTVPTIAKPNETILHYSVVYAQRANEQEKNPWRAARKGILYTSNKCILQATATKRNVNLLKLKCLLRLRNSNSLKNRRSDGITVTLLLHDECHMNFRYSFGTHIRNIALLATLGKEYHIQSCMKRTFVWIFPTFESNRENSYYSVWKIHSIDHFINIHGKIPTGKMSYYNLDVGQVVLSLRKVQQYRYKGLTVMPFLNI